MKKILKGSVNDLSPVLYMENEKGYVYGYVVEESSESDNYAYLQLGRRREIFVSRDSS